MQDNNNVWTERLAWCGQYAVLALLLSGCYQPPLRLGALRALHAWDHVKDSICVHCG